ncbi:MAG: hypothetical protein WBP58_08920 [Chitinophagaceae bacterium]
MKYIPIEKYKRTGLFLLNQIIDGSNTLTPEFEGLLQRRSYKKGVFLQENQLLVPEIIKVEKGSLRVIETRNGTTPVHGFLTPGDVYFDYLSHKNGSGTRLRVQAMESSSILALEYKRILEFCKYSIIARAFLVNLATHCLLNTITHRRLLSGVEAKKKIQIIRDSSPHWISAFTQRDLSSYLGMAEESYNRLFHQMD